VWYKQTNEVDKIRVIINDEMTVVCKYGTVGEQEEKNRK
jgi:hypothetical protein